jgi:exonuclease III
MMPKILFWNLNKNGLAENIKALCEQYDPDVIALAECELTDDEVLGSLNADRQRLFSADLNLSKRIKIFSAYGKDRVILLHDDDYFSIRLVKPYLGDDLLMGVVHLPSKLHAEAADQMAEAANLARIIREIELKLSINKTVLIGDFNMSPFEHGMVSASGVHAISDQKTVSKIFRTVRGKSYPFFYNPMWGTMGDLTKGPPGTHRYTKAVEVNYFWHTFDQVVLRPGLLKYFSKDDLCVIEAPGSDHFPLFINIKTEVIYG